MRVNQKRAAWVEAPPVAAAEQVAGMVVNHAGLHLASKAGPSLEARRQGLGVERTGTGPEECAHHGVAGQSVGAVDGGIVQCGGVNQEDAVVPLQLQDGTASNPGPGARRHCAERGQAARRRPPGSRRSP